MMEPQSAKGRYIMLSLLRLASAFGIAGGMIIAFGEREFVADTLRMPIGITLMVAGFVTLLLVIPALTRRWATPK